MILQGEALNRLKELHDSSIDTVITDPPYGYSFMGKDWDKAVPSVEIWQECLRVLKPGAFMCVMSAPRSDVQNAMISRLMEAGFRLDFTPIYWTFASGFPKAGNTHKLLSKRGIDSNLEGSYTGFQPKPAVEVVLIAMKPLSEKTYVDQALANGHGVSWLDDARIPTDAPVAAHKMTDGGHKHTTGVFNETYQAGDAGQYTQSQGRFPANLLVENSILDYNVCRCTPEVNTPIQQPDLQKVELGIKASQKPTATTSLMESPEALKQKQRLQQPLKSTSELPNITQPLQQRESQHSISEGVSLSEAPTVTEPIGSGCKPSEPETTIPASSAELPKISTSTTSNRSAATPNSSMKSATGVYCALHATGRRQPTVSSQQYSRFFDLDAWATTLPFLITPKASKSEKNKGLEHFEEKIADVGDDRPSGSFNERLNHPAPLATKNHHPTVKPLKLMSYLITLFSRPGDTVLDPFLGSGTTVVAAKQLNRKGIGIEREDEYVKIAIARLDYVEKQQLNMSTMQKQVSLL